MITSIALLIVALLLTVYAFWGTAVFFGCLIVGCLDELSGRGWALCISAGLVWFIMAKWGYDAALQVWVAK